MVEKACLFICIFYAPGFLKSSLTDNAPLNVLKAFQDVFEISKVYPELGSVLLTKMQQHTWYLTEELVLICLADDDLEDENKKQIIRKLAEFESPAEFCVKKPNLPNISSKTQLQDLGGPYF